MVGNVIRDEPTEIASSHTHVTACPPVERGGYRGCLRPEGHIEGLAEKMDELVVGVDHPQRCFNFPARNNSAGKLATPNSNEGHIIDATAASCFELAQHRFVQGVGNEGRTEQDHICPLGSGHRAAHIVVKQFLILDFRHRAL